MFARFVSMRLKSGNLAEFNRILDKEVIPLLQRQKGFREETVSIWEQKENAESYNREKFLRSPAIAGQGAGRNSTGQNLRGLALNRSQDRRSRNSVKKTTLCATFHSDSAVSKGAGLGLPLSFAHPKTALRRIVLHVAGIHS